MFKLQLSVRRKIIAVVVLLSLCILAFGAYISFTTLQHASVKGRFSKVLLERFRAQLDASGGGDLAAASFIATDPALVRALKPVEAVAPSAPPDADEDQGGDKADKKKPPPPEHAAAPAAERRDDKKLEAALGRIADVLAGSLDPEIVAVVDPQNGAMSGPGLTKLPPAALRESRLLQDIRGGAVVRSKVAILDGVPYLVSGARIVDGDRYLGAVIVGKRLQTFFTKYAVGSGPPEPEKQHRVSFFKSRAIIASALPKDEWEGVATELIREKFEERPDGDSTVPVLVVRDKDYDFYESDVRGYDGMGDPGSEIGKFVMVRTRADVVDDVLKKARQLALYFGAAALVAIAVGLWLARHIMRPIDRYIEATQGLADGQGDLTQRLEVQADDELGRLAKNLNRVFEQIHGLAGRVQQTAFRVGDSSGQLSASSRLMLDGAKTQAVKIENSTAAVTELSASIQQVAENAGEATKVAQKSGSAAENAIRRLEQIRTTVEEAGARIKALGESGKRIGSIVEVIRHISEQTTLLALNAAIEAAHAGEQGRGFAVVADEVSNLAKRVGRSAKDIEDLIATIRDQTSEAVQAMQVGTREVEEGTKLVTNTLADLKTLIGVVEDTANAVSEQAIASDEIARNMDAVRTIAREVLSSSERAATEGDHLSELAHVLEESVKGFKIEASGIADVKAAKQLPAGDRSPALPAKTR